VANRETIRGTGAASVRRGIAAVLAGLLCASAAQAQSAGSDASSDAQDALRDALLAVPNRSTPVPDSNQYATAPGVEQAAPSLRLNANILAPLYFNSNAPALGSGGSSSLEGTPVVLGSVSMPAFEQHLRLSAAVSAETDRYASARADFDKLRINVRAQYTNPTDDQALLPFLAYVPRLDFTPTFAREFATRQDVNLGINKTFNYAADFTRVPIGGNSAADAVWSFGVSALVQHRFREPPPASNAVGVYPSASYSVSPQWGFLATVGMTQRWFDQIGGFSQRSFLLEPAGTLEYVMPDAWFGGNAALFGRPALDLQVAFERNWSNLSPFTASVWFVGFAFKFGWRS
jgi:hypothetical protein